MGGASGRSEMGVMINVDGSKKQHHALEQKISVLLLYWSIIMPVLTGMPFMPSVLKYGADVLWVGLVLCVIKRGRFAIKGDMKQLVSLVVLMFGYAILTHLVYFQSAFYFLWGFRNLFRFYIAFFAYANLMNEKNAEKWFFVVDIVFWINIIISVFQFAFLGVRQDYLGGVFGIDGGSNGYTIVLLCIVVIRHMCLAFEQKESLWKCMWICVASLMVSAMAELKVFFVILVLILLVTAMLTKFSFKKVVLMLIAGFAAFIGAQILVYWFGFENFFSISGVIEQATRANYSNSMAGDVNRLSAIPTLNRLLLESPIQRLFGLGLGNCDTAGFEIFNTPFFSKYSYLHYTWFTAPKIYLEMGYIGLAMYIIFFVLCLWKAYKTFIQKNGNRIYCQMAIVMAMICCVLSFYNASLSYEAAYMIYFVLALPFLQRSTMETEKSDK